MEPFLGSEALAAGRVRKHQLRANFRAVYPNVYVPADAVLTLRQRAMAGWLWSGRRGVVGGLTAAALHGAQWVDPDEPVELIHVCGRPPVGIRIHAAVLQPGETGIHAGLPVTTPLRTAFDLGRRGRLEEAVARLDALARATSFDAAAVHELAQQHRHSRGLRHLERALTLVDAGAQSPRETRLRLMLTNAGLPRPQTQIPVCTPGGQLFAYLDMGWENWMVAVEYDGDQHRVDRRQYVKDIRRLETLAQLGWTVVRVVAEDRRSDVLRRVRAAIESRQVSLQ
ncbi:hypothetical protein LV457_01040 [Mycobacterium sp. MYCO198283]|uniref:hypothetical protein n=1 Tax=Mycobacterium sp. MYCO198283 TaxID=2883505 RepID=UPI001E2E7147|nr:hypothetical protein [Mycobacterium sp. MYCO198283]MCG5430886.1 hypothetical protein [Mycobacterium sp. MYCO198283]